MWKKGCELFRRFWLTVSGEAGADHIKPGQGLACHSFRASGLRKTSRHIVSFEERIKKGRQHPGFKWSMLNKQKEESSGKEEERRRH